MTKRMTKDEILTEVDEIHQSINSSRPRMDLLRQEMMLSAILKVLIEIREKL